MKRKVLLLVITIVLACAPLAYAQGGDLGASCPKWGWHEKHTNCIGCHGDKPQKFYKTDIDLDFCWIKNNEVYFNFVSDISHGLYMKFKEHLFLFDTKILKKVIISLKSYGGGYFDSLAIISLIEELQAKGVVVEIRVYGNAASGAFLILLAGTKGNRLASPTTMVMWHEIISGKFFAIETTSSKETEAEMYRYLQNNVNEYIAKHSNITKEELDRKIKEQENKE